MGNKWRDITASNGNIATNKQNKNKGETMTSEEMERKSETIKEEKSSYLSLRDYLSECETLIKEKESMLDFLERITKGVSSFGEIECTFSTTAQYDRTTAKFLTENPVLIRVFLEQEIARIEERLIYLQKNVFPTFGKR